MQDNYSQFIQNKELLFTPSGMDDCDINEKLFNYQYDIVKWALKLGRAAIFEIVDLVNPLCRLNGQRMLRGTLESLF